MIETDKIELEVRHIAKNTRRAYPYVDEERLKVTLRNILYQGSMFKEDLWSLNDCFQPPL